MPKISESQLRASANYRRKHSGKARFPGTYLSDEEADLLEEMALIIGSKKEAIIAGLLALRDNMNKQLDV